VRASAAHAPARASAAQETLRRSLGVQGVVDIDPLTGTPRVVARLDGFLTGPTARDPRDVVLDYVREHPGVFRLDEDDLAGLRAVRDYTDVAGIRHLHWAQTSRGIPAFDNDLRASVTADGRLINVLGSPLPDLGERASGLAPALDATGGVRAALRSVGRDLRSPRVVARGRGPQLVTRFAGGHRAGLVFFHRGGELVLSWDVTASADADEVYSTIVDAASGEVLRRANKVEEATGLAWDYFPSTGVGGGATSRNLDSWLEDPTDTSRLFGPNAHVFSDLNDNNQVDGASERITATSGNWDHVFSKIDPIPDAQARCDTEGFTSACSWDSADPGSWQTNRRQNGTQVFYFVNNFHDHLENDPDIGFDAVSGNFEGDDRLIAHSSDGANVGGGFLGDNMPDEAHLNNANMLTPPDGESPRMQMYLFTWLADVDPTADANGGDDASIVYHEYTHGLSNRLIPYSNGWGALDAHQSGAMGEAWSDWYAMDYLVAQGFETDDAAAGDVVLGAYLGNGQSTFREQAIDCATTASGGNCGAGGFTYGDVGEILDVPEVHADGEIWAQTLWDLRVEPDLGGVGVVRGLVTEGMRLSPPNPSFLDMRNAILQADTALNAGAHQDHIWEVFANRGMGYFAAATTANDTEPVEDFQVPPAPGLVGTLRGVVRDPDNGNRPVAGARVAIANNPASLTDVTDSLGRYSISGVPVGEYPRLTVTKKNYDGVTTSPVLVEDGVTTIRNLAIRRDWSTRSGRARIASFSPPDYSPFGCGPRGAIDQSHLTGWGSDAGAFRQVTIRLPSYVDVKAFAVDPGATCGDPAEAALRSYRLYVSQTGRSGSFVRVKSGSFGVDAGGRLNLVALSSVRKAVRYVRLTMRSNHGDPSFMDMSELSVYGKLRPSCFGQPATKVGTEARNGIRGTRRADVIVGLGGNDRISARGGNDLVCGGPGNDVIVGAGGIDRIDAGSGNDRVNSRDGRRERTIRGGSGSRDRIRKDRNDRATGFERRF
jgi:hypothetical protein